MKAEKDMLPILLLVLGSSTIALQETTTGDADPTTFTTAQFPTDETFPTTLNLPQTIVAQRVTKARIDVGSCKNQFLCNLQRKSTLSKGFPPVPSKNLVPPFTDSEEEELKTTEESRTTLFESETETPSLTTLFLKPKSYRSSITPIIIQKRDNPVGQSKPEATNELRSYLPPVKISPAPAQIDLSYLPPQGVLPAAAAASLDISRVNFQPPAEESPAAAQTSAQQLKPEEPHKDICSDAFHSFLCSPLKSRKRITGALPNSLVPSQAFTPESSNAVQNSVSPAKPKQTYLPSTPLSSTPARPSPSSTSVAYAPLASNEDRSYLPPAPKPFDASPSFNSVRVAHAKETPTTSPTTQKKFTSTPRPFIQTSIIPFIAPKVIEQINLLPSTTTKKPTTTTTTTPRPTTTTRRPTTTTPVVSLYPEPSNEINRGYLPPATTTKRPPVQLSAVLPTFRQKPKPPSVQIITDTTKRVTTTTPRYSPAPSNADRNYLPPEPSFQSAAAAQAGNRAYPPVAPAPASQSQVAAAQHDHHDHHDHHHHGRDICTDPFHSFLCAPLKQRKRITGALPPGFNPQSSNRKETRLRPESTPKPEPSLNPENTFQSETRVKPTEEVPAANAFIPQSVGYQYPKPSPAFPLPSQTATEFVRPVTQRPTPPRPTPPSPAPSRPTPPRPNTPRPTTPIPTAVTGYNYPRPSNPFPLPTRQNVEVIPKEDRLSPIIAAPQGYQYPKPSVPFPLPSQQEPQRLPSTVSRPLSPQPSSASPKTLRPNVISTTAKPLQPQPSDQRTGYQYPKPAQSLPLPGGYRYPKPSNPLVLPVDVTPAPSSSPSSFRDLGSAEFIPVNKIDAKRQVTDTGLPKGSPRFGERIHTRVRQLGIPRIF